MNGFTTYSALQNAASVAVMFLTIEASVADLPASNAMGGMKPPI